MTTIYPARRVITMNPGFPSGEAVAVRDGRVLGVGSVDELASWGQHTIDEQFADKVIMPGFIEAHTHVMSGGLWQFTYCGFFDRTDPHGTTWDGCKSIESVVDRLIEIESTLQNPGEPLLAWGLDPIYMPGERLIATHLDRVSTTRPIFVYHASGHLATVNTAMLEKSEITEHTQTPGVARNAEGQPNGELQEPAAMSLAASAFAPIIQAIRSNEAKWLYAQEGRNTGHTLVTDLGTVPINIEEEVDKWRSVASDPGFPVRVMIAGSSMMGGEADPVKLADRVTELSTDHTDKLRFGIVKMVLDGSIQGFTARLTWPYYFQLPEGAPENGLWLVPPDQIADLVTEFHQAGLTVHAHCNGDQTAQVFIDAVETALERHPRWNHRHTVQHCQLTTPAQYRKMAELGMCANIFANHIFYWGDQHRDVTVGPERAARMNACGTAVRERLSFAIHSDAPITPMGSLHTAWCAVNRLTATGKVLGPDECITVDEALKAITIGAAYQLKLDHEMGSIEAGKLADFAILDDDPFEVAPVALKDVGVWGTMLGGVVHQAGPEAN